MDSVTDLINRFKAEETSKLHDIDKSRKPSIVSALEDFTDDARVVAFLLAVATDEHEYDLARIEVFKTMAIKDFVNLDVRLRVAMAIREVLGDSGDDLVRSYAAMAAENYMDIEEVVQELDRILHDKDEDCDLRWNTFADIERSGASAGSIDSLRRLLADDEFRQSATRVLSEWGAT